MQANTSLEGQAMRIVLSKGGTQPTSSESGLGTRDPGSDEASSLLCDMKKPFPSLR